MATERMRPAGTASRAVPSRVAAPRPEQLHLLYLQRAAGNKAVECALRGAVPVVQRVRVPGPEQVGSLAQDDATDRDAHTSGLERAIARRVSSISTNPEHRDQFRAMIHKKAHEAAGGEQVFDGVSSSEQARHLAKAIGEVYPESVLSDPATLDKVPDPGSEIGKNLNTLVDHATTFLSAAAAGGHDETLADVFGPEHVATAKERYAAAASALKMLLSEGKITVDQAGYSDLVACGGLANTKKIWLPARLLKDPGSLASIVGLIHEAMHAGDAAVIDHGYDGGMFTKLPTQLKLTNAAHYEIAARRHWNLDGAYPHQVFTPTDTAEKKPSVLEQGGRDACELIRHAWTTALNLHHLWVHTHLNRGQWTTLALPTAYPGATAAHFADCMPYWSKVQAMTVHGRSGIDPASTAPATAPVTQIDIAVSEDVVWRLSYAQQIIRDATATPEATAKLCETNKTPPKQQEICDMLIDEALSTIGTISGNLNRDIKVIDVLATAYLAGGYAGILKSRSPDEFTD